MKKIIMIILCVFMIGCQSKNEVIKENTGSSEKIEDNNSKEPEENIKYYVIDNSVISNIEEIIKNNEFLSSLVTRFNGKALVEIFDNSIQITMSDRDLPTILFKQNEKGEFIAEVYINYFDEDIYIDYDFISDSKVENLYFNYSENNMYYGGEIIDGEMVFEASENIDENIKQNIEKKLTDFDKEKYRNFDYVEVFSDILQFDKYYVYENDDITGILNYYDDINQLYEVKDNPFIYNIPVENYYVAKRNDLYTIIDSSGKSIIEYQYGNPMIYKDYLLDSSIERVNLNGKDYASTYEYNFNNYLVEIDNEIKVQKLNGNYELEFFDVDLSFIEDGKMVRFDKMENLNGYYETVGHGFINNKNKKFYVDGYTYQREISSFGYYFDEGTGQINIINSDGENISSPHYISEVKFYNDDYIFVGQYDSYWGIINKKGEMILPLKFDGIAVFNNAIYVKEKNFWKKINLHNEKQH